MGASALVFSVIEYIVKEHMYVLFVPFCKEQTNMKERDVRSKKGIFCVYRMIYFMFAVAWGYYILKD